MPSRINSIFARILFVLIPVIVQASPWPVLLNSVNLPPQAATLAEAQDGGFLILEGASPQAESLGIHSTTRMIDVRGITDFRHPKLPIIWEQAAQIAIFELPKQATVFAKDRSQ